LEKTNKNSGSIEGSLIMIRLLAILLLPLFLVACGGGSGSNPFAQDTTTPSDPTPDPEPDPDADPEDEPVAGTLVPASLARDIESVSYDPDAGTLTVNGLTLDDATDDGIEYRRRAALDIRNAGGDVLFEAYTVQDDALDRHVTVFARESLNGGTVRAAVGHTGGPRNRVFRGAFFERDEDYDPASLPEDVSDPQGNVRYAGDYVGLTNVTGSGEDLDTNVPIGTDPALVPTQAAEVTGVAVMVADFADGAIEGNILDRELADTGTALPSIVLVQTGIGADGTFIGNPEYEARDFPGDDVSERSIGRYGGLVGGTEAGSIAGALRLNEFDGPGDNLGLDGEEELGIFVLDRCGHDVDDPICASVTP
jgi:hypothetical protein